MNLFWAISFLLSALFTKIDEYSDKRREIDRSWTRPSPEKQFDGYLDLKTDLSAKH